MTYTNTATHTPSETESSNEKNSMQQLSAGALRWKILQLLGINDFGMFVTTLLPATRAGFPTLTQKDLVHCLLFLEREQAVRIDRTGPGSRIAWSVELTILGKDLVSYRRESTFKLTRPQLC